MDIFLFVLGYIIQLIASAILLYRISVYRSIYGLSMETQVCFLAATVSRCIWTMNTRIVDSNPVLSIVALLEIVLSMFCAIVFVYQFKRLSHTTTQRVPRKLSSLAMIPCAFTFALVCHPGTWLTISSQVLVSFTMYAEAVALLPQLWLIRKMDDVETLTSHYIGLLVIARAVRAVFWMVLFAQGQRFLSLILADVIHTALSTDYLYLWVRKLRHGGRLVYSV